MDSFSKRNGYREVRPALQLEEADNALRGDLYNILFERLIEDPYSDVREELRRAVWTREWHLPLDALVYEPALFCKELKSRVLDGPWYGPYDLIERVSSVLKDIPVFDSPFGDEGEDAETEYDSFEESVNEALEENASAYRLISGCVVPIADDCELQSVEESLGLAAGFLEASRHMENALELLSHRPNPDYANSVKESISAVEAACRVVAGNEKAVLSDALKKLRADGRVHPALADGWVKIYGFTGDEGGIRHASKREGLHVDFCLAKYMLVSCSAFVNYLVQMDR
ncbi:MAG: hypothetical protein Q4D27_07655 [Coriobacteriia bacterium]|nr:hypothetical protein [Coriobacteriia bacterium]